MTGFRRTWLLWRASRYRRRADAAVDAALEHAREWRRIATDLEQRANQLETGERP